MISSFFLLSKVKVVGVDQFSARGRWCGGGQFGDNGWHDVGWAVPAQSNCDSDWSGSNQCWGSRAVTLSPLQMSQTHCGPNQLVHACALIPAGVSAHRRPSLYMSCMLRGRPRKVEMLSWLLCPCNNINFICLFHIQLWCCFWSIFKGIFWLVYTYMQVLSKIN